MQSVADSASGGDPGGSGGSKDPHFPEWGVTYKVVTPPVLTPTIRNNKHEVVIEQCSVSTVDVKSLTLAV